MTSSKKWLGGVALAGVCLVVAQAQRTWAAPEAGQARFAGEVDRLCVTTFAFEQTVTVTDIPVDARRVRVWFWLPVEEMDQQLVDFEVTAAPAGYQLVEDPATGGRLVYAEINNPHEGPLDFGARSIVRRSRVSMTLDPAQVGELTDDHRKAFASDLVRDVPFMEVDDRVKTIADQVCGDETNVVRQARMLYDYVVDNADHYSKKTVVPSPDGSQSYCIDNGGGSCTDMHSLYIALCRARGIPARLTFGSRLMPANEGKDFDPGYRCWSHIFAPGYGWAPVEVAAGDTVEGQRDFYFGGLDDNRIAFLHGRNLTLTPKQDGPPVNLVTQSVYVEVDGKPHASVKRNVRFQRLGSVELDVKTALR